MKNRESMHTAFSYWIGIIAIFVELYLGLRYINSTGTYERTFAIITLMEAGLGFIGWISLDRIYRIKAKNPIYPDRFRSLDSEILLISIIMLVVVMLSQIALQRVPLTIRNIEIAGAIVFAGPCEELFYRGFLVGGSSQASKNMNGINIKERKLTPMAMLGIIISTFFFTIMHQNYIDVPIYVLITFVNGITFAFFFWYFEDITSNIIAHFSLNFIVVWQSGLIVFLPSLPS